MLIGHSGLSKTQRKNESSGGYHAKSNLERIGESREITIQFLFYPLNYFFEKVTECNKQNVDLSVRHMGFANNDLSMVNYNIYSAAVTEVELDVLTGEVNVKRVDIIEDTGTSISPEIDVGQVEGAFVFSLGLWLTEQLRFHPESGRLLTNDTWVFQFEFSRQKFNNMYFFSTYLIRNTKFPPAKTFRRISE